MDVNLDGVSSIYAPHTLRFPIVDSLDVPPVNTPVHTACKHRSRRRGGRVAEGAGLLNQYTGNRIEGSNPSPSANNVMKTTAYRVFKFAIYKLTL